MERIRVLVVDDEPLFRDLVRQTLASEPRLDVVGVAEDGENALRLAQDLRPDAVLMDIELPGALDGIEAARRIKEQRPATGIVILSAHRDRRYVTSLPLESHGWSYLLKQSVPDVATLVRTIEGTVNGMVVLDPAVVAALRPRPGTMIERLTPRLREVLAFIAQGYNNAGIAGRLGLTEKSVETYINIINQELQLSGEPGINARVKATLLYLRESQGPP